MGSVKVRYLVEKKRRKGPSAYYWQPTAELLKTGLFLVHRLDSDPIKAAARAEQLNAELDRWYGGEAIEPTVDPASVKANFHAWQDDESFMALGDRTQRDHLYYGELICQALGGEPVKLLTRKVIRTFYRTTRDQRSMATARHCMATLRRILQFAMDEGEVDQNNALKMKIPKPKARSAVWSDAQVSAFCAKAHGMGFSSIALAARLMWALAQREGDAITIPRSAWNGKRVTLVQRKTGKRVSIRPLPELKRELARLFGQRVVALPTANREGREPPLVVCEINGGRWNEYTFQHKARAIADAAGLPKDLKVMDLRRTGSTNLGRAGCTEDEIRTISGHESREIVSTYVVPDDTMADNAIGKLTRKRQADQRRERKLDAKVGRPT